MKGLNKSLFAKVVALFLLVISFVTGVGCVAGFSYISNHGYYRNDSSRFFESTLFNRQAWQDSRYICDLAYNGYTQDQINKQIKSNTLNYTYEVYLDEVYTYVTLPVEEKTEDGVIGGYDRSRVKTEGKGGNLIVKGIPFDDNEVVHQSEHTYDYWYEDENGNEFEETYRVVMKFRTPTAGDTYYELYKMHNTLYSARYWIIILGLLMAIVFIADLIFLMCAAGHRPGTDEIVPNWQDKIPLDVYIVGMGTLMLLAGLVFVFCLDSFYQFAAVEIVTAGISLAILVILGLAALMSLATRIKTGTLFKNTLIYMFFHKVFGGIGSLFDNLDLVFKWMLGFTLIILINLLGIFILPITIVIDAILFIWLYRQIIALNKLKEAGENIASGNLDERIDVSNLKGDLRTHGENLNSISGGMGRAVEQKMKSERFRTELITNVSHDIKTPLTSIINYVDLIRKEEPEGKIDEYSQVLEKQANRLKKLLEDLLEASKASTGNLPVDLEKMDVCEIINQAVGEYSEKLEEKGLEVVVTLPDVPTIIMADGRKLWRIFDNVLNNICKYAQPETRAYVDVINKGENVVITFKNISRERLNIDSDELMERFVRGDSSRNTEGSGLGLNIAKSFAELMKGTFEIYVDGDLFKVELHFRRVNE